MTRRDILRTTVGAVSAAGLARNAAAAPRVLKNMGLAGPGIGAHARAAGKEFDIVEYAHSKGLGAAHIYLNMGNQGPEILPKLRKQLEKYDMRITISVRTPRTLDDVPEYESTIKTLSEMRDHVACVLEQFSSRRYEQFKSAADANAAVAEWKQASQVGEPILRKYKMKMAIENHKGYRSDELVEWINWLGSEYIGVCYDMCNNISMVESPDQTFEMLAPYTFFVSFKDVAADFYDEGILLSEVAFGDGYYDLEKVVTTLQKKDPNMVFQLEMITRDPLKVPIFTEEYWKIWNEGQVPTRDLAMLIGWMHHNPPKKPLPKVSGLTPAQQLALEDDLNQRCIDYAREKLPTL